MTPTRNRMSLCATLAACLLASTVSAAEIEGFTEPFRDLDVASTDVGIVSLINVKEGDRVQKDQILGTLDQTLLNATLEIADRSRNAKGRVNSAQADIRLRTERGEKLKMLLERKHATQEEFDRSLVEKEVSEAQLLAVQEELLIRGLEYDRIQVQLEQRNVRSPINGVVIKVHRDIGEFVSSNDPVIATVVQLDPLIAIYSVPSVLSHELKANAEVSMFVGEARLPAKGTVDYIAPVIDAQSGTILIKVRVPNSNNVYRSGEKCLLVVNGELPKAETVSQPKTRTVPTPAAKPPVKTSRLEVGKVQ